MKNHIQVRLFANKLHRIRLDLLQDRDTNKNTKNVEIARLASWIPLKIYFK